MLRRHRLALAAAVPTLLAVVAAPLAFSTPAAAEAPRPATLHSDHVGAVNSEFQQGECPGSGWGWHFVVPGNGNFVTLSVTFESAGTINLSGDDFGPPDDSHAYVYTPTDDTLLAGSATITGGNKDEFNLSHTCSGTTSTPTPTPPTTTPPTTTPPTSTPPTTTPPTTTPPTTTPPTTTPPTTTPPTSPAPSVLPTTKTRTPSVRPTVKGTKRTRTGVLPRTGSKPILPMTLVGLLLIAGGFALIRFASRPGGAHRGR